MSDMDTSSWSDESKALTAAMVTVAVVSVAGTLYGLDTPVRFTAALLAGFVALLTASYLLTGSPTAVLNDTKET